MHLTREQLEHAVRGEVDRRVRSHLETCLLCRRELLHVQAMHENPYYQDSYSAPADPLLAERAEQFGTPSVRYRSDRFGMNSMDAATAGRRGLLILMVIAVTFATVVVPIAYYISRPATDMASVQDLVSIHRTNLSGGNDFYRQGDGDRIADYFRSHMGFVPAMPPAMSGVSIRGGAISQFRSRPVATYLLDTPRGPVSVIAVTESPAELGLTPPGVGGAWTGSSVYNHVAAKRLGQFTYCAVGPATTATLGELLEGILSRHESAATEPTSAPAQ